MKILDKGYELTLSTGEAIMLYKLVGNFSKTDMKDVGLTDEELEMAKSLFTILHEYDFSINCKDTQNSDHKL